MGKLGSVFGGGVKKKPSHAEIFQGLAEEKKNKMELTIKRKKDREALGKLGRGRKKKLGSASGAGMEDEEAVNRPGARKATLLGS